VSGRDVGFGDRDGDDYAAPRPIEAFTGGAVALRAEMLVDVGLFDPLLFMYYEDVDLSLRGTRRGWRYRSVPSSVVRHRVGASTAKVPTRRAFYQERNRLMIAARHRPPADFARAAWLSLRRVRFAPRCAHAAGFISGLALVPRQLWLRARDRRGRRGPR
jgi:GT2 family glycosyltransferase